jgi:hypothetical protein
MRNPGPDVCGPIPEFITRFRLFHKTLLNHNRHDVRGRSAVFAPNLDIYLEGRRKRWRGYISRHFRNKRA